MEKIIETMGGIAKEENLTALEDKIVPNTLVLESSVPFPGYHGSNLPTDNKPNMIFIITAKNISYEKTSRISLHIKKYFKHEFDACSGNICIYNDTYNCIRLRGLKNFNMIEPLQSYFVDSGVKLHKKKKIEGLGIIQLKKHFLLKQKHEFIYEDLEDANMHYITLPAQLSWKMFEEITYTVKNNVDNNNYDAALGTIYLKYPLDVVRIYANEITQDVILSIRDKYIQEMNKIFQI